jgi:hypothetical protein
VKPPNFGQGLRVLERVLEIGSMLDELDPPSSHRRVLLPAVAVGHDNYGRKPIELSRESDALAVVAARRRNDAAKVRFSMSQLLEINEPTPDLEGAQRGMILVLHPEFCANMLAQLWPAHLRRRRHRRIYATCSCLQALERW